MSLDQGYLINQSAGRAEVSESWPGEGERERVKTHPLSEVQSDWIWPPYPTGGRRFPFWRSESLPAKGPCAFITERSRALVN